MKFWRNNNKVYKDRSNLIILFTIFLIEYLLFRSFVYRELIGKVPRNMDQIMYMQCSYELYDALVHRNWQSFLSLINARVQTSGIPLIGVINLFLFGNSYFSFLLMNFFAYITAQITGSYAIYKITNKSNYVWLWIGLFLALKSPFYWAGDLFDFRADFIAFCLYTCWVSIYLVYLKSGENRFFKISAIFAGIMIFCRMLSIVYVFGTLILFELIHIICNKNIKKLMIKNIVHYAGIMFISGAWLILLCARKFISYYFVLHAVSNDSKIRKIEQGVYTVWDNILFYPKSLIKDHLGGYIVILIFIFFIITAVCFIFHKVNLGISKKTLEMLFFIGISSIVPILILTIDESKSAIVVNVVSGSVLLFIVVLLWATFNQHSKIVIFFALVSCCMGIVRCLGSSVSVKTGYLSEEQCGLININDAIAKYIIDNEMQETNMFVDRTLDGINAMTSRYWMYSYKEMGYDVYDYTYNYRVLHNGLTQTTQVSERPSEQEITEQIELADIIVVSKYGYGESLYITDNEIDLYREKIWNYATDNLYLLAEEYAYGTWISVFVKRI